MYENTLSKAIGSLACKRNMLITDMGRSRAVMKPKSSQCWKPADSTDLKLVISCSSVSCLINMEPLELLRLQPSELIVSESEPQLLTSREKKNYQLSVPLPAKLDLWELPPFI